MIEIILAIIALGILIMFHELGHFLVARFFDVEVEKFSIGFGPKLIAFHKGKTEYRIALIPLGGYVKMKGENPDEEVTDDEHAFISKKWWQRALIAFAGPFANLILAVFVFIVSFMIGKSYEDQIPVIGQINSDLYSDFQINDRIIEVNSKEIKGWNYIYQNIHNKEENNFVVQRNDGTYTIIIENLILNDFAENVLPYAEPIVGEISPGMPAFRAGLLQDDLILEIDEKPVHDWYDIKKFINETEQNSVSVKIKRGTDIYYKKIELEDNILGENRIIGIIQKLPLKIEENYTIFESIKYGSITTMNFIVLNYIGLSKIITKPASLKSNLGGPILMVVMSKQTAAKGWNAVLSFFASISLILMIMNLLPIPILDGGHIFFCFIEGIFRKPLSLATQTVLQKIGLSALLLLMAFAFINDFSRVYKRNISLQENPAQIQE